MRSRRELGEVLALVREGLGDSSISLRTGVPRTTVRRWRTASPRAFGLTDRCERCGHAGHDPTSLGAAYAYLLGLYLGDGHIASFPRSVYRLSVYLDAAYPGIVDSCRVAMQELMPANAVNVQRRLRNWGMVAVHCYSRQWLCLLPQHGPGPKHLRPIRLRAGSERSSTSTPRRCCLA